MAHRYVKGTRRTSAPTRLIVAVAEYSGRVEWNADGDCHYRALRVWATDGMRKGASWQGSDEPKPYHPDDFWEYVNNACTDRSRVYIVADNASDLCTSTMFWGRLDRGDYSLCVRDDSGGTGADGESGPRVVWQGRLITGSPPDIIHVRRGNGTITIVSLRNYTEAPWVRLGEAVQIPVDGIPDRGTVGLSMECDSWARAAITTRYVRTLISGWVERDCGTWKDTVAQLSVSLWRQKFYTTKVCRHENEKAIALERASAYGGRNEVWYYGDVGDRSSLPPSHDVPPRTAEYPTLPGAIHRCDVSAQYPSILATMPFPTRLKGTTGPISVTKLEALLHCFGVIADVTVNTLLAEYPRKTNAGSVYEVGRFRTTLAGPELGRLLTSGGIETVHATAYYELGYPLQAYARYLLQERYDCRTRGDYCGELLAKCLATAIGGKFSQRTRRREPSFGVVNPNARWGPYRRVMSDGTSENYWTVAGVCYRDVEVASGGKLLAALYCYLTSYGRVQMARYRESLYPELPYAQCTDGIWVGDRAISTLQRQWLSDDRTPGSLRLVSSHSFARWFTPNHYYVDGRWVLSGYRQGYIVESADTVVETRDINHIRSCPYKAPSELVRRSVRRDMAGLSAGVRIGPDGWLVPKRAKG